MIPMMDIAVCLVAPLAGAFAWFLLRVRDHHEDVTMRAPAIPREFDSGEWDIVECSGDAPEES